MHTTSSTTRNMITKDCASDCIDITSPENVEIQTRADGKVIWVNVNGVCVLRCCQIINLTVNGVRRGLSI